MEKRYWFPVRPARNGWGWGLPVTWQGWLVFAAFLVLLIGGEIVLVPHGPLVLALYGCLAAGVFLAVVAWKGEPQSLCDERSPWLSASWSATTNRRASRRRAPRSA